MSGASGWYPLRVSAGGMGRFRQALESSGIESYYRADAFCNICFARSTEHEIDAVISALGSGITVHYLWDGVTFRPARIPERLMRDFMTVAESHDGSRVYLELEQLCDTARITVNGVDCGKLWKRPWRVDITEAVRAGENTLEIRCANQLINRAPSMEDCIRRDALPDYDPYEAYERLFIAENVDKKSYLDRMTHFDFKTLLPALLHVEDRMSMAHGIESRVPFLDREMVEFAATIPANIKFKNGNMKHILRSAMSRYVPERVMNRKDKMGFPTPFAVWAKGECREFICDTLSSTKARQRAYIDNEKVMTKIAGEGSFARNLWGFFCLELWHQQFHDQASKYKNQLNP